jgi:murein DD-endopeptidase MepM/ murein hydrolase activator NlpD
MPMVPETFAPSVTQGDTPTVPATGPWLSPMKNSAPSLLSQTGDTLARAGATAAQLGNTIGDRVQDTMDDALTKSAETQFLKSSQDVLYSPQGGYLFTRGLDAQTQWDPAAQALAKARQDARSTLTNPIQQRMFDQVTNDHMLTLGRTMADHQHGQVTQYGIQTGQDRADSMNILAKAAFLQGRMDDYQKYAGQARDEVLQVAGLSGAAPDSDIAQAMLRTKHTDLVHGITTGLLDDHKYDQAKQFFEAEQPNIDMRTGEVLANAVKTEYDRNLTETKGDAFLAAAASKQSGGDGSVPYTYGALATGSTINPMRITDVPGSPRPDGRTHDGYDIAMPAGTQVTAPLDGKVVKVWNDEQFGGGLSMRVQLADGNTLGIAHLSAANLKEGDTVNQGQVMALSGATGNATGNVLHVALTDPDGKKIDYFGASKAQPDQAGIAAANVLQNAIDAAKNDDSLDPFQQKKVIQYMESQHAHERGIQEQQYQENKQNVVDALAQNGWNYNALPSAMKAQLRPSDAQAFQEEQDDAARKASEIGLRANWLENPDQQTVSAVNEAYAKHQLTDTGYLSALREATDLQSNPQKVQQASIDHDQLTDILSLNQLPNIAQPKSDGDKLQRVQLETAIKAEINNQQEKNNRKLTWDEKGQIARDMVIDKVYTSTPTLWMGGTLKPTAILSPDEINKATVFVGGEKVKLTDIPPQYQSQAMQDLQAHRLPTTQANIAAWWVKKGKPQQ